MDIMNIAPSVPCRSCSDFTVIQSIYIEKYFKKESISCTKCNSEMDWWVTIQNAIRENFMLNQAFQTLGAETNLFNIHLEPNTRTRIKLSENGIPANARVLYINYTPQGGGLFPIEIHGNVPHRRITSDEIWIYPMPGLGDHSGSTTKVSVMITWIEHSSDENSLVNLTDAFESYSTGQYQDSIVPANVAVESALSKLLSTYISGIVSKENTEDFLVNAATYSSQLNVVLPLIVKHKELPILPDNIRGLLNKLRGLRNQIAHKGNTKNELTKTDTADVLCAALFGLKYILLIEAKLSANA
jgi:hypothetical protein